MDQLDAIIKLKNCYKELENIDKDQTEKGVAYTKSLIAKGMLEIAQTLNVSNFIPKEKN